MIIVRSTAEYQFFQGDPEAKANFLKGIGDAPVYEHHKLKILGQPLTGWSHPVQDHITSLEKEFLGVLNSSALGPADYLNAGHACLLRNDLTKALDYYRHTQELCKSYDEFIETYHADKEIMLQHGITEEYFYLIPDLL